MLNAQTRDGGTVVGRHPARMALLFGMVAAAVVAAVAFTAAPGPQAASQQPSATSLAAINVTW